jgi:predicted nucleic acid-binding protein
MSRVFWDTMLLVYLLDDNQEFGGTVRELLASSFRRNDQLVTSYLALAEALVGIPEGSQRSVTASSTLQEMGFNFLPFNEPCVMAFRRLRRDFGLRGPDAMHLACASAAEVDLFLTGDRQLLKRGLHVPGIQFIAGFDRAPL